MAPQSTNTENNKENDKKTTDTTAAGEIRPDPHYEVRKRAMDLVEEWKSHEEDVEYCETNILPRVKEHVKQNLTSNAEIEACDILMDIDRIRMLIEMANELQNIDFERICLYLMRFVFFILKSYHK
jgi:26S proteasome regulatory subunit N1